MATSIVINGRRTNKPGTYVEIEASGLASTGPSAQGVVALIGTSEGGKPLDVDPTVSDSTTPGAIQKKYRAGDLRVAGTFAFEPSADDLVSGGAVKVVGVKVNPATQSVGVLYDAEGSPLLDALSADYGAFTERVSVDVENGTNQGKRLVYRLDTKEEQFDNVGGDPVLRVQVANLPAWPGAALWLKRYPLDLRVGSGRDNTITAVAALADSTVSLVSINAADTQGATVYGMDLSGAVVSEAVTLTGVTPVNTPASFVIVTGVVLASPAIGAVSITLNASPVVSVGVVAIGALTAGVVRATSENIEGRPVRVWGAYNPAQGPSGFVVVRGIDALGAAAEEIVLLGEWTTTLATDFRFIQQVEALNASVGTVFVRSMAATMEVVTGHTVIATSQADGAILQAAGPGILTFTPASAITVDIEIVGINAAGAVTVETVSLTGAGAANSIASWRSILSITAAAATTVDIVMSGAMTATIQTGTIGYQSGVAPATASLAVGVPIYCHIRGPVSQAAGTVLIRGENAAGTVESKTFEVTGASTFFVGDTWRAIRGVGAIQLPSGYTVEVFVGFNTVSTVTYDTVAKMVDRLNVDLQTTASVESPALRNLAMSELDYLPWLKAAEASPGVDLTADLQQQISRTELSSSHVRLTRDTWGLGSLGNIAAPRFLSGGVEGTTTITQWQSAFSLLKKRDVNIIVPLTSDAAVHSLLLSHLLERASTLAMEANGYVGVGTVLDAGDTRANIKTRIIALQSRHISHVSQEFQRRDPDTGIATWWPPYILAAAYAGMQAGTAIGEPLTRKKPIALDIRNDASWQVEEDIEDMIDMGLMVAEKVDNIGVRVVRSVTGHLADDNPVFTEMSANESMITSVRRLRRNMDIKVGQRGLSNAVGSLKSIATAELDNQTEEPIILDWRPQTLSIERQADVFPTSVEILPMLAINFIPITVHVATNNS